MLCVLSGKFLQYLWVLLGCELNRNTAVQVTWPPPKTNARVGGYDFLGAYFGDSLMFHISWLVILSGLACFGMFIDFHFS